MSNIFLENLYLSSPVAIQNLMVSIAGLIEHHRRYGGVFKQYSKELLDMEFRSRSELLTEQQANLEDVLKSAIDSVPYYRNLGIEPEFSKFPVLDRSVVANSAEELISDKYSKHSLISIQTSGSSGTPITVYLTKDTRRKTYSFWNRFYNNFGVGINDKTATFLGRKLQSPEDQSPPYWRYNFIDNQLLFSSFHISESNLPVYIEKLNKFRPKIIEGYPITIFNLAVYILDNECQLQFVPNGISTTAETFSSNQREIIEKAFKCKVYDQYGSAESVIFAGDCEFGNKHIATEYGIAEVLKPDGSIANEGEGELLGTSLLNDSMPLIRYRIGDLGKISHKTCQCGRNSPILEKLAGRVGSFIRFKGKSVSSGAIDYAFEFLINVNKAQIIQNEPDRVLVKLATRPGFKQEEQELMEWELRNMLGQDLLIDVVHVKDIPADENGKYKTIEQNIY